VPTLLVATGNAGKLEEYRQLLGNISYNIVCPSDIGLDFRVSETGSTFTENALIKARQAAQESRFLSLADDSGIEVDALEGKPGVYSARFAGIDASDIERNNYLLNKLKSVPMSMRTARFVCIIAICHPNGETQIFEGNCKGLIASSPKGDFGFGYDPVFYLPTIGKTMAQLTAKEKKVISHRARAASKAKAYLLTLLNLS
jgi:XTP/dITP diphosphohydrolase